jgi:D-alanyl-D-alanine-carboxypeptidase/D-alanyl-D-alanine-endopeptidase
VTGACSTGMDCTKNYTFDQLYQALSNTTITIDPGSKYEYSTFGIGLLGNILAVKADMHSYEELVTDKILNVLGMDSKSINLSDAQRARLAIGHPNGQELPEWNTSNPIASAGALYSSVNDMLKFVSANIGLIKTKLDSAIEYRGL